LTPRKRPIAQDRVELVADGLVRLTLKRPFNDSTFAIDMDPLSLLVRLSMAVPPPRFNGVRYAGVLAANSHFRSRVVPPPKAAERDGHGTHDDEGATGTANDGPPPSLARAIARGASF
jgi:hypothetical protein